MKNEAAAAENRAIHGGNILHRRLRKRTETDRNGQKLPKTDGNGQRPFETHYLCIVKSDKAPKSAKNVSGRHETA